MSASSQRRDLSQAIEDPGFRNWILVSLCIAETGLGIGAYIEKVFRDFLHTLNVRHKDVLKDGPCEYNCSQQCRRDQWCPICRNIGQEIIDIHVGRQLPHIKNVKSSLWASDCLEIAKVFSKNVFPGFHKDLSNGLNILSTCKLFDSIRSVEIEKARKVRSETSHGTLDRQTWHSLSVIKKQVYLDALKNLLCIEEIRCVAGEHLEDIGSLEQMDIQKALRGKTFNNEHEIEQRVMASLRRKNSVNRCISIFLFVMLMGLFLFPVKQSPFGDKRDENDTNVRDQMFSEVGYYATFPDSFREEHWTQDFLITCHPQDCGFFLAKVFCRKDHSKQRSLKHMYTFTCAFDNQDIVYLAENNISRLMTRHLTRKSRPSSYEIEKWRSFSTDDREYNIPKVTEELQFADLEFPTWIKVIYSKQLTIAEAQATVPVYKRPAVVFFELEKSKNGTYSAIGEFLWVPGAEWFEQIGRSGLLDKNTVCLHPRAAVHIESFTKQMSSRKPVPECCWNTNILSYLPWLFIMSDS